MKELLDSIFRAPLWSSAAAWLICQIVKGVTACKSNHQWRLRYFLNTGGMPSSHTASIVALTALIAAKEGLSSPLFSVCAVVSVIVMYDAVGVRQETGKQSKIINEIAKSSLAEEKMEGANKLREVMGHSVGEVIAGAAVGILVGLLMAAMIGAGHIS